MCNFALGRDHHHKVMGFLAYDKDSVQNTSHIHYKTPSSESFAGECQTVPEYWKCHVESTGFP